jgi:hypothetical protein
MADPVDFTDPCATAAWLRSIYYTRVAGMAVAETRFGERSARYADMPAESMLAEIQRLDEQCALQTPGVSAKRHAIKFGSRAPLARMPWIAE